MHTNAKNKKYQLEGKITKITQDLPRTIKINQDKKKNNNKNQPRSTKIKKINQFQTRSIKFSQDQKI